MALEYYLIPNHLHPDSGEYMAVSSNTETYNVEDIYDSMTVEGSTVTKAEALAGFELITRGVIDLVRRGYAIVTPLVNFSSGVDGVFESEEDVFNPDLHKLNIYTSPGRRLRKAAADIEPRKIAPRDRLPKPTRYFDNRSVTKNRLITPGKGARIEGSLLKFDEEDERQGVFIVNTQDHSAFRVEDRMLKNKPGELIFINPELPAGTYRLEVRSIVKHATKVRTGLLNSVLTVNGEG